MIEVKMNNNKFNFLYNSISDLQKIISSIDTKISILLIFLIIPVTNLSKIIFIFEKSIINCTTNYSLIIIHISILFFTLSWIIAFLLSFLILIGIHNPYKHISNPIENSLYYPHKMYKIRFSDAFITRISVKSIIKYVNSSSKCDRVKKCFIG